MSGLSKMIADFFVRENVIEHEEYEIYKYGSDILLEGDVYKRQLYEWKNMSDGRMPLLIYGARQVGKTFDKIGSAHV